jgi:hypothetical protein
LASEYGWSLKHIFDDVTPVDVKELALYASERRRRKEAASYQTLLTVIRVAVNGDAKQFDTVFGSFNEADTSYRTASFDKAGFNMFAAKVNAARAKK